MSEEAKTQILLPCFHVLYLAYQAQGLFSAGHTDITADTKMSSANCKKAIHKMWPHILHHSLVFPQRHGLHFFPSLINTHQNPYSAQNYRVIA